MPDIETKENYRVAVLLACHNGKPWIGSQIESILSQAGVNVTVFVSDDASSDGTDAYVNELSAKDDRIHLLDHEVKGSAGKNFYHLLLNTDLSEFNYIAYADQDDIWDTNKLIRHIRICREQHADGVSSNVIAFWADGREKLIQKAQPQRDLDFMFESAGPGCTFLMTPWLVNQVKLCLQDENSPAREVALHDWLTYAVCRAGGRKWVIDPFPSVRYRQHESNVVGANAGFKAKLVRLNRLRQGWYRAEVAKVSRVCAAITEHDEIRIVSQLLANFGCMSRLKLLGYIGQARRRWRDRFFLAISIVLFIF